LYPNKVDSDQAIPIYYEILRENEEILPKYFIERLQSNNQERYRVINRNLWSSNAFHPDGLANSLNVKAIKKENTNKKGDLVMYEGVKK